MTTTRLFVYGTLVPGAPAWSLLERYVEGPGVADAVRGALYDTGRGYPAATFADGAPGLVHGVVVTLAPAATDAALGALDRYEADEYRRITVRTAAGTEALAYAWTAPLDGCRQLPDGRWPAGFRGR